MRAADIRQAFADLLVERGPFHHLVWVGAHDGEELPYVRAAGVPRITVVEPIPHLAEALRTRYPDVTVVEAACSDDTGRATLHIPRRTNMATLEALNGDPVDVLTLRLCDVAPDADAAVIDVQGHELRVLAAAPWETLRLVMVETCTVDDPACAPPHETVVEFMAGKGFAEVACYVRDYDHIQRWARGRGQPRTGGEIRDVVFVRKVRG